MRIAPFIAECAREDLASYLGASAAGRYHPADGVAALSATLGSKTTRIGYWQKPEAQVLPDFIIVRDEDEREARAWLSAFMDNLSPITQWCRIWNLSAISGLEAVAEAQTALPRLTSWVGAILAECAGSLTASTTLKEVSGVSAAGAATYAAARAVAVWGSAADLSQVARRYDEITSRFKTPRRGFEARGISSLWYTLHGGVPVYKIGAETRALEPFKELFDQTSQFVDTSADVLSSIAGEIATYYQVDYLADCAVGPQSRRVDALDRVARQLVNDPRSAASDAILGFAASLIDPGIAVMPELLRRYSSPLPYAPIWTGAFSGAWSSLRLMSDYNGLGRLISKELTRQSDLFEKPNADISFTELMSWTDNGSLQGASVKSYYPRVMQVELISGVTLPVVTSRDGFTRDASPESTRTQTRQQSLELDQPGQSSATKARLISSDNLTEVVRSLAERVSALETAASASKPKTTSRSSTKSTRRT